MKPKYTSTYTLSKTLLAACILAGTSVPAWADDTEIYLDQLTLPPEQTRANVVFVLDSSGSMGLPISGSANDNQEINRFDNTQTYPGEPNFNGGAGDSDYVYFYQWEDGWYAEPFVYFNKVHRSQLDCDYSTIDDGTPYTMNASRPSNPDSFLYDDGSADWADFCAETDPSCGFVAAATGPKVDCRSERASNVITDYNAYPYIDNTNGRRANGLYMVDENFHNYLQGFYRFSVMQQVMKDLIDDSYDINMSVMEFVGGSGGRVIKESVLATDPTNQTATRAVISDMDFDDSTPLTETLWEAMRYLRGETATYGGGSVSDAFSSGTTYDSPIDYACQKSHIIMLTDGEPTSDNGRDSAINTLTGSGCSQGSGTIDQPSESCLDDLAEWLHTDDSADTKTRDHISNSILPETQEITVHTIGFGLNNSLLQTTASNGGGLNATANNAEQLLLAFTNVLNQVEFESDTSVAPAVAVNSFSGLQHRDELYFALYRPDGSPRWTGNLKKYKLVDGKIVDANDNEAIDPDSGYFEPFANSYWTTGRDTDGDGVNDFSVDGDVLEIGGFATELTTPTSRNMLTYTGTPLYNSGFSAPTPVSLTNENLDLEPTNSITDNANIAADPTLLGPSVTTTAYAREIINWVRGGTTDYSSSGQTFPNLQPNFFVADIIHNSPSVVTYDTDESCVESDPADLASCFDDTIFFGTNLGTFHAVDPDNGEELFAFIPQELLPNLTTYYEASGGFTDKVYGLDGAMQVWRYDEDGDGDIDTGDHVYIYQPMRRGGQGLYALDVTNRNNPRLLWQIQGTGLDASPSGDYRDLAQTWSSPQRSRINWCGSGPCEDREVLFFGGGYDPVHDDATSYVASSAGNAIYMVDATTGELIWSAGDGVHHDFNISSMENSITAEVTVGDLDGDLFADVLFAVDIQGRVFRFDLNADVTSASDLVVGGAQIANLGMPSSGGTSAQFRRFYNAPDVAYFAPKGTSPFLTISIASGHRADPREEVVDDRLYVFIDPNVVNVLSTRTAPDYNYVGGAGIVTETVLGLAESPTQYGWYLPLDGVGEKGLSRTVTFDGLILMSTFLPSATNTCEGSTGEGRYYILDALTGETALYLDAENNPYASKTPRDENDTPRNYGNLAHGGIPPEPTLIFGSKETCKEEGCDPTDSGATKEQITATACIGTECLSTEIDLPMYKTYWRLN